MSARILVVDDSPLLTKLAQDQLTEEGYDVKIANGGPAALRLVEDWPPDLVILDVMMPEMNGFDVCRQLRQMNSTATIPIIMLSTLSGIADKKSGFEAGADDFITKPYEGSELTLRVASHLRRVRMATSESHDARGRVITVFSPRGGSGCSSLAVNLAVGLSQLWDRKVPLVDLGMPTAMCDVMLNLKPRYTFADLVEQSTEEIDGDVIEGYLTEHSSGVRLLGGAVYPPIAGLITDNMVAYVLEHLRIRYPYVVVDTSHDYTPPAIAALDAADIIVLPLTPDINSARAGQQTLEVFAEIGYPDEKTLVVLNWTFAKGGLSASRIEKAIEHPIKVVIPHADGVWSEAINIGQPVMTSHPESPLVYMLEDLAWRVSTANDRSEKPQNPTHVWKRISSRAHQRATAAQNGASNAS